MKSLYIDTSTKYLCIGIAIDYKLIYKYQKEALKMQSELTIPVLKEALNKCNLTLRDINEIIITIGPGSFTGIRIGMCIAKVLASIGKIKLKAISSLNAYASTGKEIVILDAKASRAYLGIYNNNVKVIDECVVTIDKLKEIMEQYNDYEVVLDTFLVDKKAKDIDVLENMNRISTNLDYVKDVDALVPIYLKDR